MSILIHHGDVKLDRLRQVPMFEHANTKTLRALSAAGDEVDVPAGGVILRQGQLFHNVYVVMGGVAEVVRDDEVVSVVLQDEIVGEVALFCHCPASGTIRARTDLALLVIPATRFRQILHDNPDLTTAVARHLALELLEADPIHEGHHVA